MPSRQPGLLLGLLVLAFAFLLASFPARNSDLWAHLANGRALAGGQFVPPAPLPEALPAQPTWLFDLGAYLVYATLGGAGLVLVKALLVVLLAAVLLQLSRTGSGWTLPALCTALALLAMSTRLLVQPATLSLLALAVALWLILTPARPSTTDRPVFRLFSWPLLLLFFGWANTDGWFLIGLGVVALVWIGQILDESPSNRLPAGRSRILAFLPLLLICVLNPITWRAFVLPAEFARGTTLAPFQRDYPVALGMSPAVLAYYPLLLLGMLSFFVNAGHWRWERVLPWVALAITSGYFSRAIPFFAVVAGPVLALNLQEALADRAGQRFASAGWTLAGRAVAILFLLVLLGCAWPGWLQAPPYEPRRWAVEIVPALEHGAAMAQRWHEEGKLRPDGRALHLSAATAGAFAWFCPKASGIMDRPLAEALRHPTELPDGWAERMRSAGIDHLVVYDEERGRLFATLERLLADPNQWPLLFLEGDLAVFGWRDPRQPDAADRFRSWQLDLDRLAFEPSEEAKAPRELPEQQPRTRRWWEAFWKPSPPRPIDRDEATLHLLHAEVIRRTAPYRHLALWEATQSAGLVGAAVGASVPGALLGDYVRLAFLRPQVPQPGTEPGKLPVMDRTALTFQKGFTLERDDVPPALLYLAVRAARRALAANPVDARAQLILGQSYLRLMRDTRERAWRLRFPELGQLRNAQAATALARALALEPTLDQAHLGLAGLYRDMGYLDLSLEHLQTALKLMRQHGGKSGQEQAAGYEAGLERLAKEVEERERASAKSPATRIHEKAAVAMGHGLAGKALRLLLDSDLSAFGMQGMALELELLLRTGRAQEVREWTAPEQKASLGGAPYHWLRAQALAATGHYALAEEECGELARELAARTQGKGSARLRGMMAESIGLEVLEAATLSAPVPFQVWRGYGRAAFQSRVTALARGLRQEANVTTLRGLLALEQGDVDEARAAFQEALAVWKDEQAASSGAGVDFLARVIAQGCLAWLQEPR